VGQRVLYTCSNHLFVTFTSSEPGLQSFVFTFLFDGVSLGCSGTSSLTGLPAPKCASPRVKAAALGWFI
jgi:hypothetical protein